jgi:hypothetical protein
MTRVLGRVKIREPQIRKDSIVKRFASVVFDGMLAACERDDLTRSLASLGATVTSWNASEHRSYASVELTSAADTAIIERGTNARVDEPALVVLRVTPRFADRSRRLLDAFAGAGCPGGVRDARADADGAVTIEIDATQTAPLLTLALIDVETDGPALRRIEALVTLSDATLAAFAGVALREPTLDASRIIETYLEPLLAGGSA